MTKQELKEYNKEYQRERRARLMAEHKCTYCQKQDSSTMRGRCACRECTEKLVIQGRMRREAKRKENQEMEELNVNEFAIVDPTEETVENEEGKIKRKFYKVMVRRQGESKWTDWSASADPDVASRQYDKAKAYGYEARIKEKIVTIKKNGKAKKFKADKEPTSDAEFWEIYKSIRETTAPEDILLGKYLDLAGAIIADACDEYKELLYQINNERIRRETKLERLKEIVDKIMALKKYFTSFDCNLLTLQNGAFVQHTVEDQVRAKLMRRKSRPEILIFDIFDFNDYVASLETEGGETEATGLDE